MERRTVVVSVIVRSPYLPSVVSSYIHTWTDLQLPNRRILCQRELISRCEELACNEVRGTSQGILMLLSKPTACWPFTPVMSADSRHTTLQSPGGQGRSCVSLQHRGWGKPWDKNGQRADVGLETLWCPMSVSRTLSCPMDIHSTNRHDLWQE